MQSLLFQLCVEVNKVGAHALPRPTLQELLRACLNQALQKYHSLVQQPRDKVNSFASPYEEKQTKKNSILYINMLHINVQLLCKHQKDMPSIKGPQNFLYMNSCAVRSNGNRYCVTFKPVYCGLFCWFLLDALSLNAFDSILTNIIKVIQVAITKIV